MNKYKRDEGNETKEKKYIHSQKDSVLCWVINHVIEIMYFMSPILEQKT